MRVLHVLNNLSDRGNGIVNLAIDLAIAQQHLGHEVAIAAAEGGHADLVRANGVKVFLVDQTRRPLNILKATLGLRALLRRFRPDVVHAHMQTGLVLALPWTKLYRVPLVAHLHNVHDRNAHTMGRADRLITVSAAVEGSMRGEGVPASKLRVVLNGTLHSARQPLLSSITPKTLLHPAIVTVAGMNHRKGIAELLEAFARIAAAFPEAHLYLVGDGPDRVSFEEQARALSIPGRVHFEGFQAAPQRYLLAADVFVLASRRDSCPLVLGEAREAGCAIIASDVDGIPEALDRGEAGLLVPPQSPAALAEALALLLGDLGLRRSWQQKAKANLERFSVKRMAEEVLRVYEEMIVSETPGSRGAVEPRASAQTVGTELGQ